MRHMIPLKIMLYLKGEVRNYILKPYSNNFNNYSFTHSYIHLETYIPMWIYSYRCISLDLTINEKLDS